MKQKAKGNFITRDHPYVYLGGSLIALLALSLLAGQAHPYSFLTESNLPGILCRVICWAFLALSGLALIIKMAYWKTYRNTFMKHPVLMRVSRWFSYVVVVACVLALIDRALLQLIYTVHMCMELQNNPTGFVSSMVYMSLKGKDLLLTGIWTTIRIALLGTAIAFVLAIFMVFLRIQEPDKRDNDFVKAIKWIANHFARFYIFIIRGTPMMVQALIFYYFGFNLFKRTNMTVTEINQVWSFFISGLCTVSLNSTAYITEVLRGGIQAIDRGQTEAARSLGMSNWQSMIKVVFPQAVKNSIPAIGNEFIINIKDSSVLSVIGVMDLMYATKSVSGIYFRSLEIYCVAAILYLILTWLSSQLLKYLGNKLDTPYKGITSSN
ncbi:MAG: amino acid ABC transporter permease [Oscillospiraceae bacterium]|nr:amino acid ABC transporter permease [Oscillospiraceae bacterium]MBQ9250962.1 amino acid ABC transporter permease [Oscillospiraceae bacterium]